MMDISTISAAKRDRVMATLDIIRDDAMSLASHALRANRAVRMGDEDDAAQLALVIGQCASLNLLAQSIARDL